MWAGDHVFWSGFLAGMGWTFGVLLARVVTIIVLPKILLPRDH